MSMNGATFDWVNNIKYLGIMFTNGNRLHVDCNYHIEWEFYTACNALLCNCNYASEPVKLTLDNKDLTLASTYELSICTATTRLQSSGTQSMYAGMIVFVGYSIAVSGYQSANCNISVLNCHLKTCTI